MAGKVTNTKDRKRLPDKPGVYFFLDNKGEIIYIGKATSLRDRVKSYFSGYLFESRGPVIVEMLSRIKKIKWEETSSVLEALILEANLIKKFQPKYNTKEKSDKSFNYVCIINEEIPKVITVRGINLQKQHKIFSSCALPGVPVGTLGQKKFYAASSNSKIFGPFPNGSQLKEALKIIRRIFPYVDASSSKKQNYEFYKQLKLTPSSLEEYKKNIRNIKLFFQGKKKDIVRKLEKEMKEFAKRKEFEKAGEIKRQIFALKHINDVALLKEERESFFTRIESYDIAHLSGKNMVGVMTVIEDGEINKNEYRKFKIQTQTGANDAGALVEVLERRFNHPEWRYPGLIVVDGNVIQINATKRILAKLNLNIPIIGVVKDEKHRPKNILGDKEIVHKYEREILLANNEAHRFAISYHKNIRAKNFLK